MFDLSTLYRPLTAQPHLASDAYMELPPCSALKPFVACFWGTPKARIGMPGGGQPLLVIPDTCMDILFDISDSTHVVRASFAGMSDSAFAADEGEQPGISRFAIRFPFWSIHLFSGGSLQDTCNALHPAEGLFPHWERDLGERLAAVRTLEERKQIAEHFLLSRLNAASRSDTLLNATYRILASKGSASVKDACAYAAISQRQLERIFANRVGVSVKKASGLVRYQNVWRDMVYSPAFNIHDAVAEYGYADQAHLLNEFRKRHSVTPHAAKRIALART